MAFSAMRFCKLSYENPSDVDGNSALVAALVEDGSNIGGLESEIRIPDGGEVSMMNRRLTSANSFCRFLEQALQAGLFSFF